MACELIAGKSWWYLVISSGWSLASDPRWGIPKSQYNYRAVPSFRAGRVKLVSLKGNILRIHFRTRTQVVMLQS